MQIKCDYCGSYISEQDEFCSQCGAVNANFKRSSDGTPKTIEELKAWYMSRNLPPEETTRFFIGKNYKGPRAFGIYEENGEYIVYKNKNDGSRAVRYKGSDQAYAVNELYLKLKSEILNQKAHNINNGSGLGTSSSSKSTNIIAKLFSSLSGIIGTAAILVTVGFFIATAYSFVRDFPYAGNYYKYGNDVYYCGSYVDDDWYVYDYDTNDYLPVYIPQEMYDNIQSYKYADNEEWDESIERFEDTDMGQYVESLKESSSSDDDYSWSSSDSWDSDSSDWDSDW